MEKLKSNAILFELAFHNHNSLPLEFSSTTKEFHYLIVVIGKQSKASSIFLIL